MPEVNFDGLVGLTHSYAGLSYGNVASARNQGAASSPRAAALQGLAKMEAVAALGLVQGVLPPHERPHVPTLRALGFGGASDADVIAKVAREDPVLLARVSSASAMWTANAATVMPGADSLDGRTHFVTANLREMFHRAIEPPVTARVLRAVFADRARFEVHEALPARAIGDDGDFGDEGAANHTRLTATAANGGAARGVHFFVYGAARDSARKPTKFPARQTRAASERVAEIAGLDRARCVFAQQNADAIDAGVFHNDVIAVGNGNMLFCHELAFEDRAGTHAALRRAVGESLVIAEISRDEVTLDEVVKSYLFNSQLLTLADGSMALVCPIECAENARVKAAIDRVIGDRANPLARAIYMDVRESMRNGGGPACLRLRVPMTAADLAAMNRAVIVDAAKLAELRAWVTRHYRETLRAEDLADPALLRESRDALDELTRVLALGAVYDFQR